MAQLRQTYLAQSALPAARRRTIATVRMGAEAPATFELSKLDWDDALQPAGEHALALHRDLLRLRRDDSTLNACIGASQRRFDAAVLTDTAFVLRYFGQAGDDRLLIVNLSSELVFSPSPEPLLGPPLEAAWSLCWSSEEPRYGGGGVADQITDQRGWRLPAHCALLFEPTPRELQRDHEDP